MKVKIETRRFIFALLLAFLPAFVCATSPSVATASTLREQIQQALSTASSALQQGDNATAEKSFRDALALDPASVMILNNLAIAVARQHRDNEAIALYERALRLAPEDRITRQNLGVAYFRASHYKLALPLLEASAQSSPTFQALDLAGLDLFALDRYQESAGFLAAASALKPEDLPTLNMLGKAYLRTKNYPRMTEVFTRIMAVDPASPEAHFMLGIADDKLFHEDDAITEFQSALKADPHYPGAHTSLGVIYWRNDNLDAAESEFRQELNRYPRDPIANCTLGQILQKRNRLAEAIQLLKTALEVNPSYKDALLTLGEIQVSLDQPREALQPLQAALKLSDDAQAHYILGSALLKLGRAHEGMEERAICGRLRAAQRLKSYNP